MLPHARHVSRVFSCLILILVCKKMQNPYVRKNSPICRVARAFQDHSFILRTLHVSDIQTRCACIILSRSRLIFRLLLNRSTCPTFAYNRYNEPSCSMECDIENKEDTHKNTAHSTCCPRYFSYLYTISYASIWDTLLPHSCQGFHSATIIIVLLTLNSYYEIRKYQGQYSDVNANIN